MVRLLCLVAAAFVIASEAKVPWCNGTAEPDLDDDTNMTIIYAQAPLLSTNPKVGQNLKFLHFFHTALILNQGHRYWTLEFDAAANLPGAISPTIEGDKLIWDLAARWCLWEGIYHNHSHWTTRFDTVASITPSQFRSLMTDFVAPLNSTNGSAFPQYNLWRVESRSKPTETLVQDITCGNGVTWAINYLRDEHKVAFAPVLLQVTRISINAEAIRHVNTSVPNEWSKVMEYYSAFVKECSGKTSLLEHILLFFQVTPFRYVYDANTQSYVEILGNRIPYFRADYEEIKDTASPPAIMPPQALLV